MDLVFLDTLKSLSGYSDVRSVRSWLARMNVPLQRIGRNYAADKILLEQQFQKVHRPTGQHKAYVPIEESEKAFLLEISDLLSRRTGRYDAPPQ